MGNQAERLAGPRLGERGVAGQLVAARIHRRGGADDRAPRQLELDEHLRRPVLQRLEGADGHPELLPDLEILHGHVERRLRRPHHLRGERNRGHIAGLRPGQLGALVEGHLCRRGELERKGQRSGRSAIHALLAGRLEGRGLHAEEPNRPVAIHCRDERVGGVGCVEHMPLRAGEVPAGSCALAARSLGRALVAVLLPGHRHAVQPLADAGQQPPVARAPPQQLRRPDGRQPGLRRQHLAELLLQRAEVGEGQPCATLLLGQVKMNPAQAGNLAPEAGVDARVARRVAVVAEPGHGRLLRQEPLRLLAERNLIFAWNELEWLRHRTLTWEGPAHAGR